MQFSVDTNQRSRYGSKCARVEAQSGSDELFAGSLCGAKHRFHHELREVTNEEMEWRGLDIQERRLRRLSPMQKEPGGPW